MKKLVVLALALVLVLGLAACSEVEAENRYIYIVSHSYGITNEAFNESAQNGLLNFKGDFGPENWDVKFIESPTISGYTLGLNTAIEEGAELIWAIGRGTGNQLHQVALANPARKFAIIDWAEEFPQDNVAYVQFKEHEGSFLVGIIAGLTTQSNKVGYFGGISREITKRYEVGFRAGVRLVNPDAEVIVMYDDLGTTLEPGEEFAKLMIEEGADILYQAVGGYSVGVAKACVEHDIWFIGVDYDQSELAPANTLTSMLKLVDAAVYSLSRDFKEGIFPGGNIKELGLLEGGVGFVRSQFISLEILRIIEDIEAEIKAGSLIVPYSDEGYELFVNNLLD